MKTSILPPLISLLLASPSLQHPWETGTKNAQADDGSPYVESMHPCMKMQAAREKSLLGGNDPPFVLSSVAKACLDTVPINIDLAQSFLKKLPSYLAFQSTLSYLSNPPSGSKQKPVDLLTSIKALRDDVGNGKFTNQLRFEDAVRKLFLSCHDENLSVEFGATSVVRYQSPFSLLSLSLDGKAPQIYCDIDVGSNPTPTPIIEIDGKNVTEYLLELCEYDPAVSADARWNNLFATNIRNTRGLGDNLGTFRNRIVYPGKDMFTITYANGTTAEWGYEAVFTKDISGVDSGEIYYSRFAVPSNLNATDEGEDSGEVLPASIELNDVQTPEGSQDDSVPTGGIFTGYWGTEAMVKDYNDYVGGFKINDDNMYALAITQFAADDYESAKNFQLTVQEFLRRVREADIKKRLIIDVKGCDGDANYLVYDTIKQLFPQIEPYAGQRCRYSSALNSLLEPSLKTATKAINAAAAQGSDGTLGEFTVASSGGVLKQQSILQSMSYSLNTTLQPFPSSEEMLGPHESHGDKYTSVFRTDFSNPMSYGSPITISGYGRRKEMADTPPVFYPESIILLSDSSVSGSCALFSEILTRQLGVRSVVVGSGGNDVNTTGDVIGGSRGMSRVSSSDFERIVEGAMENGKVKKNADIPEKLPLNAVVSVNMVDNIRPSDDDGKEEDEEGIPLQFMQEKMKADCKIWKTREGYDTPITIWSDVAEIAWGDEMTEKTGGGGKKCAVGSLKVKGGCTCGNGPSGVWPPPKPKPSSPPGGESGSGGSGGAGGSDTGSEGGDKEDPTTTGGSSSPKATPSHTGLYQPPNDANSAGNTVIVGRSGLVLSMLLSVVVLLS